MKKTKKLLSMLTALAITASAFAGLAIPASAAATGMSVDGDNLVITSDKAQDAVLLQAAYSGTALSKVTTSEVTLTEGDNTLNLAIAEGTKLFLWNKVQGEGAMVPLCAPITFEKEIEPTVEPTAEPTPEPTPEPTEKPAPEGAYFYDRFNYESTGVAGQSSESQEATMGNFKVYVGARGSGGDGTTTVALEDGALKIVSGGYATSSRGASIAINEEAAAIPAFADVEDGNVIEYFFDAKFTNAASTIQLFGITSNTTTSGGDAVNDPYLSIANNSNLPLNEWVTICAAVKKDKSGYITIEDQSGNLIYSTAITASGDTFEKLACYGGSSTVYIDNFGVIQVPDHYGTIEATVKTTDDAPLADTNVTVEKYTVKTGADGKAVIPVANGTYKVVASKSGYEHTAELSDDDSAEVTVNTDTQQVNLSLFVKTYIKLPETVTIGGGQTFVAAPKTEDTAATAAYTVTVLDQYDIAMKAEDEYSVEWNVYPAGTTESDDFVSISREGVVSVAKGFEAKSENGVDAYDVSVTVKTADRGQTVAEKLYIGNMDIIYYEPLAWSLTGGSGQRGATQNLENAITLPDMSSITTNISFGSAEQQTTMALNATAGKLVGLQYQNSGVIKAWTGWSGNSAMNQSGDVDQFANSFVLVDNYTAGTPIDVTFVIDKANKNITISSGGVTQSIPYTIEATDIKSLQYGQYRNANKMDVNGFTVREPDNNYLSVNGAAEVAKVSGKTVERDYVLGMSVIVPDETFTWSVDKPEGAADGKVTISDGKLSIADDATPGVYTVKAVSTSNADKKAELKVKVDDFQTFTIDKAEISGPHAYQLGTDTTGTYKIEKLIDSIGDDAAADIPAPVWSSSNTAVATIDAATGVLTVVGAGDTTIKATVTNGTAVSEFEIPVTVGTYYVKSTTVGSTVDVSSIIASDKITGYQVTVADADGKQLAKEVVQKDGATVAVPAYTGTAASVEVAPVFEYAVGAPGSLGNLGAGYDIAIPADTYNFNVKDTGGRCDVYVNKQMLVNNILQGSSAVDNLDVNDIIVSEGVAKITTADYANGANENGVNITIKVVKSPSNVTRKQKVYVLGDSLVCIYYNGGSAANNLYQTGWGQVLQSYVKDDVEVVDLGNSGVTAEGLAGSAITQVAASAKSGDIVLIESGYNDRSYSTQDKMKAALASMKEKAEAKGADVIFVSPNASHHDYSGNVVWTGTMESYVEEASAKYIDLSQKSYDFLYSRYGSDFASGSAVNDISKIYNVSDRLHSTFNGANAWAAIVAGGLIDNGYGSIVNTSYKYEFTDGLGNTVTCQAAASN